MAIPGNYFSDKLLSNYVTDTHCTVGLPLWYILCNVFLVSFLDSFEADCVFRTLFVSKTDAVTCVWHAYYRPISLLSPTSAGLQEILDVYRESADIFFFIIQTNVNKSHYIESASCIVIIFLYNWTNAVRYNTIRDATLTCAHWLTY